MAQELDRNLKALKEKADPPPYFLSCEVTGTEFAVAEATLGAIEATNRRKSRVLVVRRTFRF